jgi:hypothetical protein
MIVPCQNSILGRIGARRSTDNLGRRNGVVIWMSAYCCLQWLGCGRERKETGHPVLFIVNNMNMALTQHGVRNGDADRRPQESLSLRQVLHPESAVLLAHPYRARGEYDIYDNNQNIVPGFFANVIPRE